MQRCHFASKKPSSKVKSVAETNKWVAEIHIVTAKKTFSSKSWPRGPNASTPAGCSAAKLAKMVRPRLLPLKMSVLWADDQNREPNQLKAGLDASTPKANLGTWILKKKKFYVRVCLCVCVCAKAVDTVGWLTACDSSLSVWYQSKLNDFFFLMTGRLIVGPFFDFRQMCRWSIKKKK